MDDIVAVEVALDSGERRYFLTWGRIQDAVDPAPLATLVLAHCSKFALDGSPVSARVRWSLRPASGEPYFHEALFKLSQRPIPFGPDYPAWKVARAEAMASGKELHYLGRPFTDEDEPPQAHAVSSSST